MSKKRFISLIFLAVVITLIANVFFGRWLSAKISTLPLLNKFKIISPQAPIVINNQQIIRSSDSTDIIQASQSAKSKLSAVVIATPDNSLSQVGGAVNLTSDGIFVTGTATFSQVGQNYFVVLSDGTSAAITTTTLDSATGLTFFKAATSNISPASIGNPYDLLPGEKVLFINNSAQAFMSRVNGGIIGRSQSDVQDIVFDSDKKERSFGVSLPIIPLLPGTPIVNLSGQIVGLYNGNAIVSGDVIDQALSLYLTNSRKIARPVFGFTYSIITTSQSKLLKIPQGALIKTSKNKELLPGDIITKIGETDINQESLVEISLNKYLPGDNVNFKILRNNQEINITIKAQ